MRRPSPWLILVVILLGALILREPRLRQLEDVFLNWFMQHAETGLPQAPITLVEIGRDDFQRMTPPEVAKPLPKGEAARRSLSPLEFALFLQAVLSFKPTVVALEPIVVWRDRDKLQEQVFIDQAMRVPKLLVAVELGGKGPHDPSPDDLPTLSNVAGTRGNLAEFTGVSRQPDDDIRLISTPGFINLPGERSDRVRVPMLLSYRGEIVPSFPLQAIMLWLRLTPEEVKVELGSRITLPNGWEIPLHADGTTTINPAAKQSVRRLSFSELLLAAQEHEKHRSPSINLENLKDQIVLLRLPDDPLQPPDVFATAIATIQTNAYVHAAPWTIAWVLILAAALLSCFLWMISRSTLVLGTIAFGAGYGLLALALLGQDRLWLPTFLPFALLAFLLVVRLVVPEPGKMSEPETS
ncbi:MAG: CHASE2 domain-containing protein [Verrucomicrobiota bacterium]|nr:CHASE2 domain-containing protein [Verrucomicrobiota bacterium]